MKFILRRKKNERINKCISVGGRYKVPSWSTGTDAQIVEAVQMADRGEIDLTDYWSVGDERIVHLSAMEATGVGESHAEQDVTMVLMSVGGKTFVSPTAAGKTECNFIVGMKNCLAEIGYINSVNAMTSWKEQKRKDWCNGTFKDSFPASLISIFKQHINKSYDIGSLSETEDYFSLPAGKEIFGTGQNSQPTEAAQLTQFDWYKTVSNREKKLGNNGSETPW